MQYKIVIPDTPCPLNRLLSMHWGARKRVKDRFNQAVLAGMNRSDLPRGFQDTPKKVHVDTVVYISSTRGRLYDPDAICKHLFDCLADNGMVYDDSQKWLSWSQPIIKRDPANPRTVIYITIPEGKNG